MASLKRKTVETPSSDSPQPRKIAREDEEETAPQIQSDEPITCLHEVSYPPGYAQLRTDRKEKGKEKEKPAKEFPFQLDPFQAEAIGCLEIGESVMVGPHLRFFYSSGIYAFTDFILFVGHCLYNGKIYLKFCYDF
jgi:ATP-dependent RNA helicase DOB1